MAVDRVLLRRAVVAGVMVCRIEGQAEKEVGKKEKSECRFASLPVYNACMQAEKKIRDLGKRGR